MIVFENEISLVVYGLSLYKSMKFHWTIPCKELVFSQFW